MRFKKGIEQELMLIVVILAVTTTAPEFQRQFVEDVYEALVEEQVLRGEALG